MSSLSHAGGVGLGGSSLIPSYSLASDDEGEDWTPADEARMVRTGTTPTTSMLAGGSPLGIGSTSSLGLGGGGAIGSYGPPLGLVGRSGSGSLGLGLGQSAGSYGAPSGLHLSSVGAGLGVGVASAPVVARTMSISVAPSYASPDSGSAFVHPDAFATDISFVTSAPHHALAAAPAPAAAAPLSMPRAIWTLLLCTATYLVCMAQRYSLGVVAVALERRLHFGDGSGSGMEYQLLAGPAFNLLFTCAGVALAACARDWSRTRLLTVALLVGCGASLAMGAAQSYAQLALARAAQGLSQAGVASFCASLLTAAFPPRLRGRALSIFNFGVYAGYGAAFGAGNWLAHWDGPAESHPDGYRLMFYVFAAPSLLCAVLMAATVRDPAWEGRRRRERAAKERARAARGEEEEAPQRITLAAPLLRHSDSDSSGSHVQGSFSSTSGARVASSAPDPPPESHAAADAAAAASLSPAAPAPSLRSVFWLLVSSPPLIVLCLASSLRNGAGIVWGYNTQQWFTSAAGGSLSPSHIGAWMSWIPLVFGSLGALLGGAASDCLSSRGPSAQIALLVVGQLLAAPCAAGVLLLSPPAAFLMLLPAYLLGETYIGACMAMLMDRTPPHAHALAVALYVFCIANLGGNAGLLLPPLQRALGGDMQRALLLLWPGLMVAAAAVYALLWCCAGPAHTAATAAAAEGEPGSRKLSVQVDHAHAAPLTEPSIML